MLNIEEIEQRLAKATPGPWTTERSDDACTGGFSSRVIIAAVAPRQGIYASPPSGTFPESDRHFIAHAPTDIANLLSELKSLRAENARLREALLPFARVAKSYDDFVSMALPHNGGEFLFPLLDSNGAHYMVGIGEEDFRRATSVLGERG